MRTYLFKITTDKQKGIGHFYRSFTISKWIKQSHNNVKIYFLSETKLKPEDNLFRNKVSFLNFYKIDDILLILKNKKVTHFIFDQVSDCFKESTIIKNKFKKIKIFAFDYYRFDNNNIDKFINIYSKKYHQILTNSNDSRYSYGFKNVIIREKFNNYINTTFQRKNHQFNIVITFGGSDPMNYTQKILDNLTNFHIKNVLFKIIIPLNKKSLLLDFKLNYKLPPSINLYHNPRNIMKIFSDSDLVICGGGGTLYEFCYLGKPILAIGQNLNEKNVIDFLSKNNFINKINSNVINNKMLFEKLILNYIKNDELLRRMSKKASKLIDKNNYYKIVDNLM